MLVNGIPVFVWPINWSDPVNGSWNFNLLELLLGFGPELTDIQQDHIIHGWEFGVDLRESAIDDLTDFLNSLEGRARPFWLPGPAAQFKISDGAAANSFIISEQGAASSWQLHPGGYIWFTRGGDEPQVAKITSVVDNGDGTETVAFEQVLDTQNSSSSSVNSSSSTVASFTSSSSSGDSSASSLNSSSSSESSQSSVNSSSSGHSSSSSEGNSSSSSGYPESTSSSSAFIPVDETWQVFPLFLVRLADDNEAIQILAERWQHRTFRVVELPSDYAVISQTGNATEPSAPVYLYRFTADLPDGAITWRFTSHPEDLSLDPLSVQSSSSSESSVDGLSSSSSSSHSTSPSSNSSSSRSSNSSSSSSSTAASVTSSSSHQGTSSSSSLSSSSKSQSSSSSSSSSTSSHSSSSSSTNQQSSSSSSNDLTELWLAVGIEHAGLSRSTKLGGTVTITADYSSVEPLRLLVPMRLAVPLRVEILKTNRELDEPVSVFNGVVRSPELTGLKIKVDCSEWGESMEGQIPNFYIQRVCNYRVYDQFTCRADRASKQVAVTISAAAGRTLIITGALSSLAKDWFAQGTIELGAGLNRRVYFVMGNSAPFGNQMEVYISQPFDLETPVGATIIPGCDGLRSTCIAKFDNLVNFGGHATPRENLTLVAIKVDPATGGKK